MHIFSLDPLNSPGWRQILLFSFDKGADSDLPKVATSIRSKTETFYSTFLLSPSWHHLLIHWLIHLVTICWASIYLSYIVLGLPSCWYSSGHSRGSGEPHKHLCLHGVYILVGGDQNQKCVACQMPMSAMEKHKGKKGNKECNEVIERGYSLNWLVGKGFTEKVTFQSS